MNGETAACMIYVALAILYAIAVQGITYRLMYIDSRTRLCPDPIFYEVVIENPADDWNKLKKRWSDLAYNVGWLADCFQMGTVPRAAAQAKLIDRQQQAYLNALRLVCSLSTLFGLLGTVSGFLIARDVSEVGLNTAFMTTFWGIVIGVPPAVYLGVTKSRRDRFESQIDLFLDRLKQVRPAHLTPPSVPLPDGGHQAECHQQTATTAPPKVPLPGENCRPPRNGYEPLAPVTDEQAAGWLSECDEAFVGGGPMR